MSHGLKFLKGLNGIRRINPDNKEKFFLWQLSFCSAPENAHFFGWLTCPGFLVLDNFKWKDITIHAKIGCKPVFSRNRA